MTIGLYFKEAKDKEELQDLLLADYIRRFKVNIVETRMKEKGWKLITEEWLARVHSNGSSWMHQCASSKYWSLAKKTDTGRVRCKACGKMLDEGPQMLLTLQRLKATR